MRQVLALNKLKSTIIIQWECKISVFGLSQGHHICMIHSTYDGHQTNVYPNGEEQRMNEWMNEWKKAIDFEKLRILFEKLFNSHKSKTSIYGHSVNAKVGMCNFDEYVEQEVPLWERKLVGFRCFPSSYASACERRHVYVKRTATMIRFWCKNELCNCFNWNGIHSTK